MRIVKIAIATVGALCICCFFVFRYISLSKQLAQVTEDKQKIEKAFSDYQKNIIENQQVTLETSRKISSLNTQLKELKNEAFKTNPANSDGSIRVSVLREAIRVANATTSGDISE